MDFVKWIWRENRLALLAFAGLLGTCSYVQYGTSTTHTACVAKGYPEYYVTWTLEKYCIKRINNTDYVAKLDTLR